MNKLLKKEFTFTAHPIVYFFISFSLLTLVPSYPIVLSAFFMGLGFFQNFQIACQQNDVVYSAMLPVRKRDIVTARYLFVIIIEVIFLVFSSIFAALRMTVLADAAPFAENMMINANIVYLAWLLIEFCVFNVVFVGGFWKTAYKVGKPFFMFSIWTFVVVGLSEAMHHIQRLQFLNSKDQRLGIQISIFIAACAIYILFTLLSIKKSQDRFERIDL